MIRKIVFLLIILFLSGSCRKDPQNEGPTPYPFVIPQYFPQQMNIPADNPLTVEGVELGRYLFYDGRLSGRTNPDSMMSCATCHVQANSFVCGISNPQFPGGHPFGIKGVPTHHTMLPLINLVWNTTGYLWDGSVSQQSGQTLEDIVWMTVVSGEEMCGDTTRTKELIASVKDYPPLFKKAFGTETVTMKNISRAIAQFVRTLVSSDSRFDRYLRGEVQLNQDELSGYVLFVTEEGADCFHCHGGDANPLFTTGLFYNNGKDTVFSDPYDRYAVTGSPQDIGAYKAPTLRNLVFRAPYMHDGRFTTIGQVIDFYSSGLKYSPSISPLMHHVATGGVLLTPSEKASLKAFLLTLTDSSFVTNPAFSRPEVMPE